MKILRNSGFTPKPYCLKPIYEEESKFYYPGIFMQHFNGKEINSFKISKTTKKRIKKIKQLLREKYGIKLLDHDSHNFIFHNRKLKIIDFTHDYIFHVNKA